MMNAAMAKTLTVLFLVASFLMLITSSCMSKEEKRLDNIVRLEKEQIPQDYAFDVKVTNVTYSPSDSLVTYTFEVEPGLVAGTIKNTTVLLKQGFIINLMSDDKEELKEAVIDARACIRYNFYCDNERISTFEIKYTELKN